MKKKELIELYYKFKACQDELNDMIVNAGGTVGFDQYKDDIINLKELIEKRFGKIDE